MAPNKFEQQLKQQLNEREIQPSEDSWNRLNSRLNNENGRKINSFFWYSIAAGFVGLLIISGLYFDKNDDQNNEDVQIVDSAEENSGAPEIIRSTEVVEENTRLIKNNVQDFGEKTPVVHEENIIANKENESFVRGALILENVETKIELSDSIVNVKIIEVMAQLSVLETDANALTNAEVDSLLRNAQKEILNSKIINQNSGVDAMAMLSSVEEDIDQSFRNKIFESLKRKFVKAKTAVADRNN